MYAQQDQLINEIAIWSVWYRAFFFVQGNSLMNREIHVMNDLVNLGLASWSDSVTNAHGAWIIK